MSPTIWHITPKIQFVDIWWGHGMLLTVFSHRDLDLRSQVLKNCTHSRSPILFMVALSYLVCRYILWPWRVTNWFQVTVTLTSGFSSSKVEPRAYLCIIWGRNPKFGMRIYFGTMACRIHFWVSLTCTCSLYINMLKYCSLNFITLLIMSRLSQHERSGAIGMILVHFESN